MKFGDTSINYMSRVHGIPQRMRVVSMDRIIPLFTILVLNHDCYPDVKSRYLAGDPALVNCNLLYLSVILSIEETMQQALGLLISTPPATANHVSDAQTQPQLTG